MSVYKKVIFAVTSILSLVLILCLKSIPSGQLWKNYTVLYVPMETADSVVMNSLRKSEIQNAVVLSEQFLPVLLSENSPEISMYRINSEKEDFSYSVNRNSYFYDKSGSYRLYYIPNEYKNNLSKCISILNAENIFAGLDATASYPWFLPVICSLIAIILLLFSKNRILFATGAFLPVIFVYCNPFYPIAISIILSLLVLFFVSNLWKRKDCYSYLLHNYIIPGMVLLSFVSPFACSVKSGLLFIVCAAGVISNFCIYNFLETMVRNKMIFTPVYIRPAKMISIFANKQKKVMPVVTSGAILIIAIFALSSSNTINAHFSKLQLPSSSGIPSEKLPSLDQYVEWIWNVKTFPYQSLNKNKNENTVEYSRFVDKGGIITESVQIMNFDQDFIDNAYDEIDRFPFNSIESVLKNQKKDITPGYSSTNSYHIGFFGIIMMLFCLGVLLFIYISIIINKGVKK